MAKIYAVKKGLVPGIYNTWSECEKQVKGYSGAEYKSFKSLNDAINYIGSENSQEASCEKKFNSNPIVDIYTDGSYKNRRYSYGFAVVKDGVIIHTDNGVGTDTEAASMQNVAGELSGAMHAVKWAYDNGYKCRIYHDYEGVGKWITKEWKARNKHTQSYVKFMEEYKFIIDGFEWVRGHSGNKFNSLADRLAGDAFH